MWNIPDNQSKAKIPHNLSACKTPAFFELSLNVSTVIWVFDCKSYKANRFNSPCTLGIWDGHFKDQARNQADKDDENNKRA